MTSPAPSDLGPDASSRREKAARRRTRQRHIKTILMAVLIVIVALAILVAPSVLLPLYLTALLAILAFIPMSQWPWRPRFALRRGGVLLALWIAAVAIWLYTSAVATVFLIIEVMFLGLVVISAWNKRRQQFRANRRDLTPGEMEQALALNRASAARFLTQDATAAGAAYYTIALIEDQRGHSEAAQQALEEALPLFREAGETLREAHTLSLMGAVVKAENPQQALDYYQQALALLRTKIKGHFHWRVLVGLDSAVSAEVVFLNNTGSAHLALDQPAQALPLLEEALALYQRHQEPRAMLPTILLNLVQVHARLGRTDQARALAAEARTELDATRLLRPAEIAKLRHELNEALLGTAG